MLGDHSQPWELDSEREVDAELVEFSQPEGEQTQRQGVAYNLGLTDGEYAMLREQHALTVEAIQVLTLLCKQHQFTIHTMMELKPDEVGKLVDQLVAGITIEAAEASQLRFTCELRYIHAQEATLSPPKRQKLDEGKSEELRIQSEGSDNDYGSDIFIGARVEVLFEGTWYKGIVGEEEIGGKWAVQCDEDLDGTLTTAERTDIRVVGQDLEEELGHSNSSSSEADYSTSSSSVADCSDSGDEPWSQVMSTEPPSQPTQVRSEFSTQDSTILTGPAITHTSAAAKEQMERSIAAGDLLAHNSLPRPLFSPPPSLIRHPGGSESANQIISKTVWPTDQLEATMKQLGVSQAEIDRWRSLPHVAVDRLINARFTVLVLNVTDRLAHQKAVKKEYASQTPLVSDLLDAEHMEVKRSTLLVWQTKDSCRYEAIALFASKTPDLIHYWGGSAAGGTGRARTLQMVSKMHAYCNAANRGKKDSRGQMWGEGLRKARFQRKDHHLGRSGLGYYRHKAKASWRQDGNYTWSLAENVLKCSIVECSLTPALSEARRLVTKAVLPVGTWDTMLGQALAERATALTFFASLDYECQLHADASACGFPESIVFVRGEKECASWHFGVPCAGIVFDLAAASPAFLVLQASDTLHGTLPSNTDQHSNIGMALVAKSNVATSTAKAALAKARANMP